MIDLERPEPEPANRAQKSSLVPITLISLILCTALACLWLFLAPSSPLKNRATRHKQRQQTVQTTGETTASSLPAQQANSPDKEQATGNLASSPTINNQKLPTGKTGSAMEAAKDKDQGCKALAARLHGFFSLLDRKEYFQQFHVGLPAQQYFLELAKKLLNNPPVVSRETDDLYTMLKNMAHFFRVIGGRNITIIKTILDRERATVEDIAADLYQWTTGPECDEPEFSLRVSIDQLYQYAGFFLNSISGRSYLFRRDSRSRLLVNYYSILLVDDANKEGNNRYGIDLRPLIPRTIDEIEHSDQLIYKERYLDTLYGLLEKYPAKTKISGSDLAKEPGMKWKRADTPVVGVGSLHQG